MNMFRCFFSFIFLCFINNDFIYGKESKKLEIKDFNDSYLEVIEDAYRVRDRLSDELIFKVNCFCFFTVYAIFFTNEISRKIFLDYYFYVISIFIYISCLIYDKFELTCIGVFTGMSSLFFAYSLYKNSYKNLQSCLFFVNTFLFSIMCYLALVKKNRRSALKNFNDRLDRLCKLYKNDKENLMHQFITKMHKDFYFERYSVDYNIKIFESMINTIIYEFVNGLDYGLYWKFYCHSCNDFIVIDKSKISKLF